MIVPWAIMLTSVHPTFYGYEDFFHDFWCRNLKTPYKNRMLKSIHTDQYFPKYIGGYLQKRLYILILIVQFIFFVENENIKKFGKIFQSVILIIFQVVLVFMDRFEWNSNRMFVLRLAVSISKMNKIFEHLRYKNERSSVQRNGRYGKFISLFIYIKIFLIGCYTVSFSFPLPLRSILYFNNLRMIV